MLRMQALKERGSPDHPRDKNGDYLCRNWRILDDAAPTAVNAMHTLGIKHLFVFCRPDIIWRVNSTFSKVR